MLLERREETTMKNEVNRKNLAGLVLGCSFALSGSVTLDLISLNFLSVNLL